MKIRTRLNILFLCIALIPLGLATAAFYFTTRAEVSRQVERRLDLHANFVQGWIAGSVEDYSARLRSVATIPQFVETLEQLNAAQSTEARSHLSKILRFAQLSVPGSGVLELYDRRGVFAASGGQAPAENTPFPYAEQLRRPGRDSYTTVSRRTGVPGEVTFHFAARVDSEKETIGYLLLRSDASVLREVAQRAIGSESSYGEELILAVRRSADGAPAAVVFRAGRAEPIPWTADSDPALALLSAARESTISDSFDEQGRRVFAVSRAIPQIDGGVILRVDRSAFVAPIRRTSLVVLGLGALIMAGIALLVRKLAAKLGIPLTSLINSVRRLESGDLEARVAPQQIAELAELEHAFNFMTQELKSSKSALAGETARVKAAELQNLWYGSILRNSSDGIIGTDLNSEIILWNEAAAEMFGYTAQEAVGRPIDIIVPSDYIAEEKAGVERLRKGENVEVLETFRRRKNGELIEVSLSISPIVGPSGEFRGAAKIARDISKRRLEEKRFQMVVEAAPTAMIMAGPTGDIELFNAHAEQLFGYKREEILGSPVTKLLPERARGTNGNGRAEIFTSQPRTKNAKTRQYQLLRQDGQEFPAEIGSSPIETDSGRATLISVVDVTEQNETERFIRNSLHEKEILLKEIHHRVKNNLQVISSLLRLQGEYLPDERSRGLFKQCDDRVRSMALIHERLYRSEGFSDIDLREYVKELSGSLVRSYAMRASKITLELDLEEARLGIDKAIPCGLLLNEFISNALKHAFDPGTSGVLKLGLREEEGVITLIVSDNGKGLPADWDISKTATLGFQIVRTLIEQLAGSLTVSRERGTTLTLTFAVNDSLAETKDGNAQHLSM